MTFYLFSAIVNLFSSLLIGFFVFVKDSKVKVNQHFFGFCLAASLWSFGYIFWQLSIESFWAIFWLKILMAGASYAPIFYFTLVFYFLKQNFKSQYYLLVKFGYGLCTFFAVISLSTSLIVSGVEPKMGFKFWPNGGILFIPFLVMFFGYAILASVLLYKQFIKTQQGAPRKQMVYILIGLVIAFIGGSTNYFLWLNIPIPPVGNILVTAFPLFIGYSIVKHRLFDIKLVIKRGSIFTVLVFLVTASYAFISYIISIISQDITGGNSILLTGGLTAILVSIGFQPIRAFLQRTTDRYLFKGTYNVQDLLSEIGNGMSKLFELKTLNEFVVRKLRDAFRVNDGAVVLLNEKANGFRVVYRAGDLRTNKCEVSASSSIFEKYLSKLENVVVYEELERMAEESNRADAAVIKKFVAEFKNTGCSVFVPLHNQDKFFGALILGVKLSGEAYTVEDINVLDVLRNQIAVALEKARLYSELQLLNENLQDRIKEATADLNTSNERLSLHNESLLALQKINSDITSTLEPTALTQTIANSIYEDLKYSGAIIILYDEKHKRTNVEAVTSSPAIDAAMKLLPEKLANLHGRFDAQEKSLTVQAIISKQVRTGNHLSDMISPTVPAAICDKMQELVGVKAVVAVPIFMENKVIGTIDFLLPKPAAEIQNFEYDIMQLLAHQTGMVWKNVELYNKIQAVNADLKKANDRLQMLDKAKTEFISIASHQLRTPLSIVKGYISMFLEGNFGKQNVSSKDALGKVYESNERLIHLVDDLLNVSRIESDRLQLVLEAVDVVALMKSVVEEGQPLADRKNLKLTFHHDKKVPLVSMDEEKMRQVFFNLIDNAVKYTLAGKIQASVAVAKDEVLVKVCDTGAGIAPEQIGELFHKFVRGKSGELNVNGTGLGLYVARKIVSAHHGGSIHAESEGEGKGSCFVVTLKAAKGKELTEKKTVLVKESEG